MSKLIGTNPNQVPSNADLGSAAFMDEKEFLLSRGSNISSIDAVLHSDAVDVFIYDTSKDSDGGAWRKRTQHTSWYNEKLNTHIRGNRKEFPAVAVIIVESNRVTIYDGDDINLPMWMVFNGLHNGSSYTWHGSAYSGENDTCAAMKNGVLCIGVKGTVSSVSGLSTVSFIDEVFTKYGGAPGTIQRSIALRNVSFSVNYIGTLYDIVNKNPLYLTYRGGVYQLTRHVRIGF